MQTGKPSLGLPLAAGLSAAALALLFFFGFEEPWSLRGDNKFVIYPLKLEIFRQWAEGRVPGWTNGMWSGYPLLANAEGGTFYPFLWLGFLLTPEPHIRALDIGTALHTGILVAGTVAFLRALGCRPVTAVFGAGLTAIAPQVIGWTSYASSHAALSWWPWLFLSAQTLCRPGGPVHSRLVLGSLPLGLQVASGYPEMALYSGLVAVAWILAAPGELSARDRFLRAAGLTLAAALVAAPQLLPTAWGMLDTGRVVPGEMRTLLSLQGGLADVVDPRSAARYLIAGSPFVGAATLILAGVAVLRRAPRSIDLALVAAVAALAALGDRTPVYDWLSQVPLFGLFRGPAKLFLLTQLCVIWLAALGVQALLDRVRQEASAAWTTRMAVGLAALSTLEYGLAFAALVPITARGHTGQELPLSLGLERLESVAPLLTASEPPGPPPRVFSGSNVQTLGSLPLVFGVEAIRGGGVSMLSGRHEWLRHGHLGPRHLDMLGVSLVLAQGGCREPSRLGYDVVVGRGKELCVLRNPTAKDRYSLVSQWIEVESVTELVRRARARPGQPPGILVGSTTLPPSLEKPEEGESETDDGKRDMERKAERDGEESRDRVVVRRYRPGAVELDLYAEAPRLLLVRESWSAGWRATVDDQPTELLQAAGIFFALPIEAGDHEVELRFEAPGLVAGVLGFGLWMALAITAWVTRRPATH